MIVPSERCELKQSSDFHTYVMDGRTDDMCCLTLYPFPTVIGAGTRAPRETAKAPAETAPRGGRHG